MPAKLKKGSVLSAVEDIQRMSPDAIVQEFDRMVEHTERHLKEGEAPHMPCTKVADKLLRCLRQHHQESYMCFPAMEDYRQCVGLAAQAYVDELAEREERQNPQLLPVVPPQVAPQTIALPTPTPKPSPALPTSPAAVDKEVRRTRSWIKPWTWLR
ncbi:hypothetical protein ACLKA6_017191 [Drosophila palustris]